LGSIETVICSNEKEALILENELIKKHQPRFNVELKDDKNFLHIRIARDSPYPRLEVVRKRRNDGALYFGPYDSASSIRNTLRLINRHFYLRTCPDSEFKNRARPCLEHQIHRCPGPCVLPVSVTEYRSHIDDVALFLSGRADELLVSLQKKMQESAQRMDYELAAHYRDQLKAVDRSLTKQNVVLERGVDMDAFGLYREGDLTTLQVVQVRGGYVVGTRAYSLGRHELPDAEVVSQFVQAYYDRATQLPDEVLLPVEVESSTALADWLGEKKGRRVAVLVPQRGVKVRLIEMATRNAQQSFEVEQRNERETADTLGRLQAKLGLRNFPSRIECYDISNTQGGEPTASQVVFIDGEPAKSEYRRIKIRAPEEPNDFLMMYEAISRRFKRAIESGEFPSLVVIDGGKGQLNAARQALADLDIVDVDIVSLAKSKVLDKGGTRSDDPERSPERVFLPNAKNAIVLHQNSSELYLLTRIRDEAHRFAVSFHTKLRDKRTIQSELDAIPGVGEQRRTALLQHFGSVKKLRAASANEIAEVPGISAKLAQAIVESLNPG
jgi:excinuclease ABC subunit C